MLSSIRAKAQNNVVPRTPACRAAVGSDGYRGALPGSRESPAKFERIIDGPKSSRSKFRCRCMRQVAAQCTSQRHHGAASSSITDGALFSDRRTGLLAFVMLPSRPHGNTVPRKHPSVVTATHPRGNGSDVALAEPESESQDNERSDVSQGGDSLAWLKDGMRRLRGSDLARGRPGLQKLADQCLEAVDELQQGPALSPEAVKTELRVLRLGTLVLARDARRGLPALQQLWWSKYGDSLPVLLSGSNSGEKQLAQDSDEARALRLQEDLVAILPFLFLFLNTFPLTPAILPLVERVVPRKYFIPSQFEEEKLNAVRRLVILRDSKTD